MECKPDPTRISEQKKEDKKPLLLLIQQWMPHLKNHISRRGEKFLLKVHHVYQKRIIGTFTDASEKWDRQSQNFTQVVLDISVTHWHPLRSNGLGTKKKKKSYSLQLIHPMIATKGRSTKLAGQQNHFMTFALHIKWASHQTLWNW